MGFVRKYGARSMFYEGFLFDYFLGPSNFHDTSLRSFNSSLSFVSLFLSFHLLSFFRYSLPFVSTPSFCSLLSSFPFNSSLSLVTVLSSFRFNSSLSFATLFLSFQLLPFAPYSLPFVSTLPSFLVTLFL